MRILHRVRQELAAGKSYAEVRENLPTVGEVVQPGDGNEYQEVPGVEEGSEVMAPEGIKVLQDMLDRVVEAKDEVIAEKDRQIEKLEGEVERLKKPFWRR